MRVLHFFKTYWPDSFGGVERTINAIARGTAEHGVESEVLSLSRQPRGKTVVVHGHRAIKAKLNFEFASTGFSTEAFSLFRSLAARADIIHYHFPWPFMDMVHFVSRLEKPVVITYHSDIVKQTALLAIYRPLMNRFLGSADRIVATSPNYLKTSSTLSQYAAKTMVIPIGLSRTDYPAAGYGLKQCWRSRLPKRFFLFTGVLRYYKGLHILLEAAGLSKLPVVIAGSGPLEAALREHAAGLRLKNVVFTGALPEEEKIALLELCCGVVFPSHLRSEAFGLSLVEAAMFSKPMISCEIGTGTSFVNLDKVTGLVVPPGDARALAEAMSLLWRDDRAKAVFSANALQRYETLFTRETMASAYTELYRELAGNV